MVYRKTTFNIRDHVGYIKASNLGRMKTNVQGNADGKSSNALSTTARIYLRVIELV